MASVKLAVPLMMVIIGVVAYGTIVESLYNAEMAKLKVYQTPWFESLMVLLWCNILFATLTRWPWKKHHLGFLITHLGLLLLLAGGMITGLFGLDGTLRLMEQEEGNSVVLSDLVLGIATSNQNNYSFYPIRRSTKELDAGAYDSINNTLGSLLKIQKSLPFVENRSDLTGHAPLGEGAFGLSFRIKSPFFDTTQWLHSELQPSVAMGPAQFQLQEQKPAKVVKSIKNQVPSPNQSKGSWLIVKNKSDQKELQRIALTSTLSKKQFTVNKINVDIQKVFHRATVGQQGINENPDGPSNPAIELSLTFDGQKYRDIVFAKYPGFSLLQKPDFPLMFVYETSEAPEDNVASAHGGEMPSAGGNEVQFSYNRQAPETVELILKKSGKSVLQKSIKLGEVVTTPWMGIQITLNALHWNSTKEDQVVPITPTEKANFLPPSALQIEPYQGAPADQLWITEGEEKSLAVNDRAYGIYYGRRIETLPFKLKLNSFKKVDYPGSSMAKSFESQVTISDSQKNVLISMNEPLEYKGYTIYQSSYEQFPGGGAASIFSVNKDPGRPLKYWGSIILCLGIVVFTVMRTRWYQRRMQGNLNRINN